MIQQLEQRPVLRCVHRVVYGGGEEQRNQAEPVNDTRDDTPRVRGLDRHVQHPRETGNAQDHPGPVAQGVKDFFSEGVFLLAVLVHFRIVHLA